MIDLDAIEARIRDCKTYNFGLWNADKLAHEDAPAMLTELRHLRVIASGNQGAIVNSIIERTRHETPRMIETYDDQALREAFHVEQQGEVTDDEREALHELLGPILHLPISEIRDRILAAGFRRSEVPEPSAEFCDQCAGPHPDEWLKEYGGHWDTCPNRLVVEMQGDALAAAQRLEVFLNLRDGSSPHDKDVRRVISALRAAGGAR